MLETKYIGLAMAIVGSLAIGTSSAITKMVSCRIVTPLRRKLMEDIGLTASADGTSATENMSFLRNPMWWAGTSACESIIPSVANFGAYTFAPPIMVTPLGALSVIVGAIFASFLLNEQLGHLGRVGCTMCLVGSSIIVLRAPGDQDFKTVTEFLEYAVKPGFLLYCFTVCVFSLVMAYAVAPKHGRTNLQYPSQNPLVYISIASLVGSVSVMFVKGFSVALKLTFAGHNQFIYPSTYLFGVISVVCIVVQLNYANKDLFSVNLVNPIYYVSFCTATIVASLILFKGPNTTSVTDTLSLLTGFVVTFLGVHILNLAMLDPDSLADSLAVPDSAPAPPLDGGSPWTQHARVPGHTTGHARRASLTGLRTPLFGAFPREGAIGLGSGDVRLELLEEDEEENVFRRGAQLLPSARSTRTSTRPPNIRISPRPV
ncbi:magnesium transporter NIPA-domain-containing protein [Mycena rosella]|uniref:Magnesium transporter NIPA-domain-containing protein n=1 Tax=Mycena rosella TaxID=1033263 RepID=A0AAD7DPN3_MYCRO|nr:magnesium transporter NIPA-domain-containing protein [Mycena rosella]